MESSIVLGENFKREFAQKFQIAPSHIVSAVKNHDQIQVVNVDELELQFFIKRIDAAQPPFSLLVYFSREEKQLHARAAFKVYHDLCPECASLPPLEILERLVERFGMELRIGERTGKFILQEKIPFVGMDPISNLTFSRDESWTKMLWFKVEDGDPKIAHCALCFAINTTKYLSWVESHKQ